MSSSRHCCKALEGEKQILHHFPNPKKERECFNKWVYLIGGDIVGLENERIYKNIPVSGACVASTLRTSICAATTELAI